MAALDRSPHDEVRTWRARLSASASDNLALLAKGRRAWQHGAPLSALLGLLIFAVMLPFLLIGAAAMQRVVADEQADERASLAEVARTLSAAVDRELRGYQETAEVLALSRMLQSGDIAGFHAHASDAARKAGAHFVLISRDLRNLLNTRAAWGEQLPDTALAAESKRRVIESGRPSVSSLVLGRISQRLVFNIDVPVLVDGEVRYVLSMVLEPESIQAVVDQHYRPQDWRAGVIDGEGLIVARSRLAVEFVGKPASLEFLARLTAASGIIASTDLGGDPSLTAYHVSQMAGWRTIAWAPVSVLDHSSRTARQFALGGLGLALALSTLAGLGAARLIRRPIREAMRAAAALGAGQPVRFRDTYPMVEANALGRAMQEAAATIAVREVALRESEARLALAQEAAGVGTFEIDFGVGKGTGSRQLRLLYGIDPDRTHSIEEFQSRVHPDDRARVAAYRGRMTAEGGPFDNEFRIVRPDGSVRWLASKGEVRRDATGRPVRAIGAHIDITKRKEVEEALRRSEERLRLSQQVGKLAYTDVDLTSGRIERSQNFSDVYGFDPAVNLAEATAQFFGLVHPEDRKQIAALQQRTFGEPGTYSVEYRLCVPAGAVRWISAQAQTFADPTGKPVRTLIAGIDITERKAAEAAIIEAQRFAQGLIDAAPSLLYIYDIAEGRNVFISPQIEAVLGYSREQIAGLGPGLLLDLLHPDDMPAVAEHHRRLAESEAGMPAAAAVIEYRMKHADGSWRWLASRDAVYRCNAAGRATQILGSAMDVTEQKRAEEANAHLAALVASSPDAIISFTGNARIRSWNPGAERMFGYTSSEAVGASADLLVPLDASEPDLDVYGAARAGQSLVKETRRRRKDGGDLPVSISAAPIRDRAGRIIAVSAIYRDISVQRRREEHTRFVMRELSHRSKNLLAIVNAMARQTARGAGGIEDFESRFSERVQGLAQSHDLLVRHDWEGVAIADLVRTQLKPFLDPDDPRVVARGPALVLRPEAAQNIGMALHELATNAIKHGALSRPTGRIDIAWAIEMDASEERRLVVSWRESGGPPVEKPKQSGFGHAVLERLAVMALGGTARLDWAREGVCWRLEAPASTVAGELVRDGDAAGKDHRRLVPEIRAPDLKALYAAYVRLKAGTRETVPRLAAFESLELAGADKLFVAAVDASTEPVRFRHLTVGEALTRRLGRPLEGQALSAPAEAVIGTLEGCYRHASGVGLPCYDRARLDLGTDGSLAFERLVVPFSEDGASVTHLIGMVCFADRSVTAAGSGREEVGA